MTVAEVALALTLGALVGTLAQYLGMRRGLGQTGGHEQRLGTGQHEAVADHPAGGPGAGWVPVPDSPTGPVAHEVRAYPALSRGGRLRAPPTRQGQVPRVQPRRR